MMHSFVLPFRSRILAVILVLVLALVWSCSPQPGVDLILVKGKVFTADAPGRFAEAIAIRRNRILQVGTTEEIEALAGPSTRRIDLQGKVVIPGINDAHYHSLFALPFGHQLSFQTLEPTWEETLAAIREAVHQEPAGTWIFGLVGGKVVLNPEASRFPLDEISPDHPVYLAAYYGHGDILNSNALTKLGIGEEDPDPRGGRYARVRGSRKITGELFEYAQWRPRARLIGQASDEELIQVLRGLADQAVRFGITSMQDMPLLPLDRYLQVLQKADLPLRMRAIRWPLINEDEAGSTLAPDIESARITLSGTKWILDGTPFEHGAALLGSYADQPESSGAMNFSEAEIEAIVADALQREDQLLFHAAGDRPLKVVFEAMENHAETVDWAEQRVRIEHGDALTGDLIERARNLGVLLVQNPSHLASVELVAQRFGPESSFFRVRSLLEAGIPLALGSDGPLNPYLNLMFASLHPIAPAEALTREQVVIAYTRGSAFAEFKEEEKGTISPGKLADLAVLSQDIFTVPAEALPATQSLLTLVGGEIVYDAERLR